MAKKDIRALSAEQLAGEFSSINEPAFRARQVYDWLWSKGVVEFGQMTNLSKSLGMEGYASI